MAEKLEYLCDLLCVYMNTENIGKLDWAKIPYLHMLEKGSKPSGEFVKKSFNAEEYRFHGYRMSSAILLPRDPKFLAYF